MWNCPLLPTMLALLLRREKKNDIGSLVLPPAQASMRSLPLNGALPIQVRRHTLTLCAVMSCPELQEGPTASRPHHLDSWVGGRSFKSYIPNNGDYLWGLSLHLKTHI